MPEQPIKIPSKPDQLGIASIMKNRKAKYFEKLANALSTQARNEPYISITQDNAHCVAPKANANEKSISEGEKLPSMSLCSNPLHHAGCCCGCRLTGSSQKQSTPFVFNNFLVLPTERISLWELGWLKDAEWKPKEQELWIPISKNREIAEGILERVSG